MALGYDSSGIGFGVSANNASSGSFTIGAGSDRYLLVAVLWNDSFAGDYDVSNVKWGGSGGEALTAVGAAVVNNTLKFRVYYKKMPTSQTSTVYADISGTVARLAVVALAYTGVDQTTPIGTPTITAPETDTPSGTQTLGGGEWIVGFLQTEGNTITPGTQNHRQENENTSDMSVCGDDYTSGTLSWTTTGVFDRNNVWVVNLKVSAGGGATSRFPFASFPQVLLQI